VRGEPSPFPTRLQNEVSGVVSWNDCRNVREMADDKPHSDAVFYSRGSGLRRDVRRALGSAALLPRRETARILASGAERRCVGLSHVACKRERIVHERARRMIAGELTEEHHLRHVMQCRIDMAMNALKRLILLAPASSVNA